MFKREHDMESELVQVNVCGSHKYAYSNPCMT